MLLPSTGLMWAIFCSNDARFTSGTMITVPESCAGSSSAISFSSATIEAYSVPWAPATSASTRPGLAPCTTTTGMFVPASLPGGTAMTPMAFCPRLAFAVPTVNVGRGSAAWAKTLAAQSSG